MHDSCHSTGRGEFVSQIISRSRRILEFSQIKSPGKGTSHVAGIHPHRLRTCRQACPTTSTRVGRPAAVTGKMSSASPEPLYSCPPNFSAMTKSVRLMSARRSGAPASASARRWCSSIRKTTAAPRISGVAFTISWLVRITGYCQ